MSEMCCQQERNFYGPDPLSSEVYHLMKCKQVSLMKCSNSHLKVKPDLVCGTSSLFFDA